MRTGTRIKINEGDNRTRYGGRTGIVCAYNIVGLAIIILDERAPHGGHGGYTEQEEWYEDRAITKRLDQNYVKNIVRNYNPRLVQFGVEDCTIIGQEEKISLTVKLPRYESRR